MYEIPGFMFSAKTAAAQEDKHVFVKITPDGLAPATAATDVICGVVQRTGIATEALPVMNTGVSMVVASAAIAKGACVTAGAGGKAVTATGAFAGIALEPAIAAGDIIPVLLQTGSVAP